MLAFRPPVVGLALAALCCAAACGGSAGSSQLRLTLTFDNSVTDAALAQVKSLVVHASGDEDASFPLTLDRAISRSERVVYRPAASTRSIGLAVEAISRDGVEIARGSVGPVPLGDGATLNLDITLSAGVGTADAGTDGSVPGDLAGADLAGEDLAIADLAVPVTPSFGDVSFASAAQGSPISVTKPSGIVAGTLLLATFVATSTDTSTIVLTPPLGWTILTTSSGSTPNFAAAWYWKVASNEPATYSFDRTASVPAVLMVAAYNNVSVAAAAPFDVTVATPGGISSSATAPSIYTTVNNDLLVVNAICPDNLALAWSNPSGLTSRHTSQVLLADVPLKGHGDTGAYDLPPATIGTCHFLTFVTSLRPN